MTGEVTLQGRVLPIGGLKQKVLAAHAAGLTDVILPERNRADLDDVPDDVRESMSFHPVMTVDEVLAHRARARPGQRLDRRQRTTAARWPRAAGRLLLCAQSVSSALQTPARGCRAVARTTVPAGASTTHSTRARSLLGSWPAFQPSMLMAAPGRPAGPARGAPRPSQPGAVGQLQLHLDRPHRLALDRLLRDVRGQPAGVLHHQRGRARRRRRPAPRRRAHRQPRRRQRQVRRPTSECGATSASMSAARRVRPGAEEVPAADLDRPELRMLERVPVDEAGAAEHARRSSAACCRSSSTGWSSHQLDVLACRSMPAGAHRAPELGGPAEHAEVVVGPLVAGAARSTSSGRT